MKLSTREWGDPKGPPVVLLHAFPMSSEMWEPQGRALPEFRLIAPDFRGFGSTPLSAPWFIEQAVDDVLETAPERAVYVGLSLGGYVAMRLAEKAPGRVRALALADTRAEPDDNAGKLKRAGVVEFVRGHGVTAFVTPFLNDSLAPKTLAENPKAVEVLRGVAGKASPDAVMAALAALAARPDAGPALAQVRVPTAVLVGSQDKLTPLASAEGIRSRVPGAELHLIPDAGHFSSAENPDAFNDRLRSFLKRLS